MLTFTHKSVATEHLYSRVVLPWEKRVKCRNRVTLENGQDAGIVLPRGETLSHGDYLAGDGEEVIQVVAAEEQLSRVHCKTPLLFARACYHLGNRHVPLQIEDGTLSYLHDHVLDEMLQGLGLDRRRDRSPVRT